MKKILIAVIIAIALFSYLAVVDAHAEWIKLDYGLEAGYLPEGSRVVALQTTSVGWDGWVWDDLGTLLVEPQGYTALIGNVELFQFLHLDTTTTFVIRHREAVFFKPFLADFRIAVEVDICDVLYVGWQHGCWHPIVTYLSPPTYCLEGSVDSFYIRVQGTFVR